MLTNSRPCLVALFGLTAFATTLLGARDLGDMDDYRFAQMPPVNTGLLDAASSPGASTTAATRIAPT